LTSLSRGELDVGRAALGTESMIEIRLQSIDNVTGFRMVIPEHTQVSDTDGGHEGADHLVELARRGPQNAPEGRVSHVKKRLYRGFRHRVALSLTLSLVCRHRLEPLLTSILELS
jgi:hypothetical protein